MRIFFFGSFTNPSFIHQIKLLVFMAVCVIYLILAYIGRSSGESEVEGEKKTEPEQNWKVSIPWKTVSYCIRLKWGHPQILDCNEAFEKTIKDPGNKLPDWMERKTWLRKAIGDFNVHFLSNDWLTGTEEINGLLYQKKIFKKNEQQTISIEGRFNNRCYTIKYLL